MSPLSNSAIVLASYIIGCVLPSYYAVKWQKGQDLRETGSGNAGATNAGRVLGRRMFIILALLDILKGYAAVRLASIAGLSWLWLAGAALAVVVGHIWPAQLKFRGGKGLATAYGVILAYSPFAALCMWAVLGLGILLMRNRTLAMLQAFFSAPLLIYAVPIAFNEKALAMSLFIVLALLMAFTHRRNIREALQRLRVPAPNDKSSS